MINLNYGFSGYFNLVVRDKDTMEIKRETGVFKNLITNAGMNRIATGRVLVGAAVGTGVVPPNVLDVSLQAQVAQTSTTLANSTVIGPAVPPYYTAYTVTYRFAEGAAAGNLSEVGIFFAANQMWSRSLILDSNGSPTTITILPNEVLDVVYECRMYAMPNDVTGGPIELLGVNYNWTMRAVRVREDMGSLIFNSGFASPSTFAAYTGALGAVTDSAPQGAPIGNSAVAVPATYINNSFKRQISFTYSIAQGNGSGGNVGIQTVMGSLGSGVGSPFFQIGLDKKFPKGPTNTLSMVFEYTWARV